MLFSRCILFIALMIATACQNSGSDLSAIYDESGTKAFTLVPMINKPAVALPSSSNPGVKYATDLATKQPFYGLVECSGGTPQITADWIKVVETRAANSRDNYAVDLFVDHKRRLSITGSGDYDGRINCRLVGRFLASVAEIDEVLASIVENPSAVTPRQYLLAQSIYLALIGDQQPGSSPEASMLLLKYLQLIAAHYDQIGDDAALTAAVLYELDKDLNPCNTQAGTLGLPAAASTWKTANYTCDPSTNRVRPGSGSLTYDEVRNLVGAELGAVHLRLLASSTSMNSDHHTLINLLTSTVDWSQIASTDTKFHPLATYLAGTTSNFQFETVMASDTYGLVSPSDGLALASDDEFFDEDAFGLTSGSCAKIEKSCAGTEKKAETLIAPKKADPKNATATALPSSGTNTASGKTISSDQKNAALPQWKEKFSNLANNNHDVYASKVAQAMLGNKGTKENAETLLKRYPQADSGLNAVQALNQMMETNSKSAEGPSRNKWKFTYQGMTGPEGNKSAVLTDAQGNYHFVKNDGQVQKWEKQTAKAADGGTLYKIPGTRQVQKVTKTANGSSNVLGIANADGKDTAWYPTKPTEGGGVAIDWTQPESQEQILVQISEAQTSAKNEFFNKPENEKFNALSQGKKDALFWAAEEGIDSLAKIPDNPGDPRVKTIKDTLSAETDEALLSAFYSAKKQNYDPQLNTAIGQMLSPGEQEAVGINPLTADPDKAIQDAKETAGSPLFEAYGRQSQQAGTTGDQNTAGSSSSSPPPSPSSTLPTSPTAPSGNDTSLASSPTYNPQPSKPANVGSMGSGAAGAMGGSSSQQSSSSSSGGGSSSSSGASSPSGGSGGSSSSGGGGAAASGGGGGSMGGGASSIGGSMGGGASSVGGASEPSGSSD